MTTTPLLMISGHLCDERIFSDLTPHLTKRAELFLAPPPPATDIQLMAEQLLEEAPEHFAAAGFSLGGMVVMAMMDMAPERLLGAALISTDPMQVREKEIAYRDDLLEAARLHDAGAYIDALLSQFFVHKPSLGGLIGPELREMMMSAAITRLSSEARALSNRDDFLDAVEAFEKPVSVIVGAADRICPPKLSEQIVDASPNATLTEIADTGHLSVMESPVAVADALTAWLERLSPSEKD